MFAQQLVVGAFIADERPTFQQLVDDRRGELAIRFRGMETLGIARRRDLRRHVSRGAQLGDAVQQTFEVAELCVGGHGTNDLVLTFVPAGPTNRHIDDFTVTANMYGHALNQAAHDLLAISIARARRVPQRGNVGRERGDARLLLVGEPRRHFPRETIVVLLKLLLLSQ